MSDDTAKSTGTKVTLKMPSDDFSRSVIGFLAALIVGALVPRTIGYLVRRVLVRSFREIFILALAGWAADFLASLLTGSSDQRKQHS